MKITEDNLVLFQFGNLYMVANNRFFPSLNSIFRAADADGYQRGDEPQEKLRQ